MGPTADVLDGRTLVLNRSWLAITTTTVRRAIAMVHGDSARFLCPRTYEVHDFDSWASQKVNGDPFIRGVTIRLRVPEVIVLATFDGRPRRTVPFSRRNLYRRDNFTCQYCGKRPGSLELTIDHIVPRSQGGRTSWENCVVACVDCNKRKGDRSLRAAGMALQRRQSVPQWSWDMEHAPDSRPSAWEHFLPRKNGTNGH